MNFFSRNEFAFCNGGKTVNYIRARNLREKFEAIYSLRLLTAVALAIMKKDERSPQDETAHILVDFLEVAVTSIVFLKGVYPSGAFERRRYMNMVAHKARHPELRDYIHFSVHSLLPFIAKVINFFPSNIFTLFLCVAIMMN
ncbi:hypothetical protein V2J09_017586 [Rumex salicifolius]